MSSGGSGVLELGSRTVPEWRSHAACRGMPSEMFMSSDMTEYAVGAAQAVCRGCMVVDDCLVYAISNSVSIGVWGGLSPDELAPLSSTWRAHRATVA
ncbi:MAG: WhiB family transcriptional regulator [Acidimicrobiia bacterium]